MSVVIAFPSAFANKQALARAIKRAARERVSVHIEGSCIVCQSSRPVELASQLTTLFGIEKVAIAKMASTNFSDLSNAIVEVGSKIIMPGHSFYVKVIIQQAAKYDYVNRDVEFAASGMLTTRLSSINARPAKSEQEASHLILTIVSKESAYVCIQVFSAPGGLVAGSQGRVLSSIHSSLSFLSCLMAAKAGFECTIVLPYADESELESNAKLAHTFATKTGTKKQTILIMPINVSAKGADALMPKEKMMSRILIRHEYSRIVFPLTTAVHPIWLIESIMQETLSAGKTPFAPLVFMSSELVTHAEDVGIELDLTVARFTRDKLQKYSSRIDSEAKVAIRHTKRLELEVGPNYLHDIIDSI